MIQINRENYEWIMFDLLENKYSSEEKNYYLSEIEKDAFLLEEWNVWKSLKADTDELSLQDFAFLDSLKKEKTTVPFVRMAAGLLLFLSIGLGVYFYKSQLGNNVKVEKTTVSNFHEEMFKENRVYKVDKSKKLQEASKEMNANRSEAGFIESQNKEIIAKQNLNSSPRTLVLIQDTITRPDPKPVFPVAQAEVVRQIENALPKPLKPKAAPKYKITVSTQTAADVANTEVITMAQLKKDPNLKDYIKMRIRQGHNVNLEEVEQNTNVENAFVIRYKN